MYRITTDYIEFEFYTLEEAQELAGRIYESTGNIVAIEEVKKEAENVQDI